MIRICYKKEKILKRKVFINLSSEKILSGVLSSYSNSKHSKTTIIKGLKDDSKLQFDENINHNKDLYNK